MTNIEAQESAIVSRLIGLVPAGVVVCEMPESLAEYERHFEDARIVVAYNAGEHDPPRTTFGMAQRMDRTFAVILQSRRLRGELGAYAIAGHVSKALTGWQAPSLGPLWCKSFDLFSDEDDLFTFVAFFTAEFTAVEDVEPDAGDPLITHIGFGPVGWPPTPGGNNE